MKGDSLLKKKILDKENIKFISVLLVFIISFVIQFERKSVGATVTVETFGVGGVEAGFDHAPILVDEGLEIKEGRIPSYVENPEEVIHKISDGRWAWHKIDYAKWTGTGWKVSRTIPPAKTRYTSKPYGNDYDDGWQYDLHTVTVDVVNVIPHYKNHNNPNTKDEYEHTEYDVVYAWVGTRIKSEGGVTPPDPNPGAGVGKIIFIPHETDWTNKGKKSESKGSYKVNVKYEGDNPVVLKGIATIRYYRVVSSKTGSYTIDYTYEKDFDVKYHVASIDVTGDTKGHINGDNGDVYITKEGEKLKLYGIGSWAKPEYKLPKTGRYESIENYKIPPEPKRPTGESGFYNLDWTTPIVSDISATSTYWTNKGKPIGYPLDFTLYEKEPGSGFKDTTWTAEDSSYYNHTQKGHAPYGGKGNHDVNLKLLDGMYHLKIHREDIANKHIPENEGKSLYGEYLVDLTDPYEAKFNYKGAVKENGIYEYMCNFENEIDITIGDNLSGVEETRYMWSRDGAITEELKNNPQRMTKIDKTRVVGGIWTTPDRNKYYNTFTLNIHDNLKDYPKKYKELKKGKWYLYIYQIDRAKNVTVNRSEPIFVNKIEDFKLNFVHDIRWQHLFQNLTGKRWNNEKKNYFSSYLKNGKKFDVSNMPLNGQEYNKIYGTNIKKGYYTEFDYVSFGFNKNNARIDVLIKYYFWNGSEWEEIGDNPYSNKRYNLFYESNYVNYYPLSDYAEREEGKQISQSLNNFLINGGRTFTHIYGASKNKTKFYNYRNTTNDTNNPLLLKNSWDMRYAFPFAEAIENSNYDFNKNQIKDKRKALKNPIMVNFNIIGTKYYSNGEVKHHYYTLQEDRWKNDPYYPKTYINSPGNGNVIIIDPKKSSIDDMYIELN